MTSSHSLAIPGADVDEEGSHDERQAISEGFHGGPNGEESHQKGRQGQRGYTEDVGRGTFQVGSCQCLLYSHVFSRCQR